MSDHATGQVNVDAARVYQDFFVPALFGRWPRHLLAAAAVRPGQRLLDVACGTGVLALKAVAAVGSAGAVSAVDINDGMLAVARAQSAQVDWRRAAAEALPFESASFDGVLSQFALMFFVDRTQALREMHRVTRDGGKVTLSVWASLADSPGYAAVTALLHELFGAKIAEMMEAPFCLGDRTALVEVLDAAGIGAARIETIVEKARFPSLEAWLYTDIKGWTLASALDDAAYAELQRVAPARLARFVRSDGTVEFDAPAHVATFTRGNAG